ncbi:putative HMP/thiamine import ATP-binding protein YkoD [Halobacillus andaensis]|uniref:HMP/thiamine import ATP-binding protein YkoD n=1 Tax=Halobacillus andaensis TaxID=1176239 RepID=A0A917B5H3_HALAA|nr:ABC transporter ATP-binding protein [Halobacillus andaensis]MBP2006109.1 energy-coupling factor transport system ATP-binding protein [Halobacillus andaensis]GGF23590.1 putative HMP/thiamine import ATP-binding protein YkoD [Halobacillus andaensis]
MRKEMIQVDNLTLYYEDEETPVFQNLHFTVKEGDTMLVLGPSGSGKSSLIQCLNGLFPRELDGHIEGQVTIHGKDSRQYEAGEISKHVGVVFQDPETQFCMLTVEDEVAFGLENLRIPSDEMETKIEEVLNLVGLDKEKDSTIATLSGGQKQKLSLACVLAIEPKVIVLDEPTANLDPIATKDFIDILTHLKEKLNLTLIVIEHQLNEWIPLLKRVYILQRNGEPLYDGPLRNGIEKHGSSLQQQGIWMPLASQLTIENKIPYHQFPLTLRELVSETNAHRLTLCESTTTKDLGEKLLEANELTWKSTGQTIIHSTSLRIHQNEFIAIVGANGSGKTSLSRLLAGITQQTSGSITVNEKKLSQWKERDLYQQIGYVFQNPEHQFITDSVYEEVAFGLRLTGASNKEIERKCEDILSICQLAHVKDKNPFTLSQGQKRRLSVASMIVSEQSLLFLDEPTFGQDAGSTEKLMSLLQQKYEMGTSIIMITHDMDLVDHFATRVLVMEDGSLAADIHPAELWKRSDINNHHLEYPSRIKLAELINEKESSYVPS